MTHGWALWGPSRERRPTDDAKEPIIMTAITTIRLNKWELAETSSYSDQIGPNEIKMPINPVLIAVAHFQKTLKYAHANARQGLLRRPGSKLQNVESIFT